MELFIMRLWLFLFHVKLIKDSGIDNFEMSVTYKFQGRTPPTQEIIDKCFNTGLHPLGTGGTVSGVCAYYYPPTTSAHLKNGMHKLISSNEKFKNHISIQANLRPSMIRQEVVKESDVYAEFPNLIDEKMDYAIIQPLNEAQQFLKRELYGSPAEFDELTIVGRITTSNGYSAKEASMKLIDTLLFGGAPLYDWDFMYRPIHNFYLTKVTNRNAINQSYEKSATSFLNQSILQADQYRKEAISRYVGGGTGLEYSAQDKKQFLTGVESAGKKFLASLPAGSEDSPFVGNLLKVIEDALGGKEDD
jgi:hypothetical protein